MSDVQFPVAIDGERFHPAEQAPDNPRWLRALSFAHRKEITHCLCVPCSPVRLIIKHYGSGTSNSRYGLARWPDTGLEHDPDCLFFSEDLPANASSGTLPAFEELDGGVLRAHLARPLAIGEAKTAGESNSRPDAKPGTSRQRASDVALLLKLWRLARLNTYRGKEANWFMGSIRLLHAAKQVVVNRAGQTAADYLLVGTHANNKTATAHNAEVLAAAARKKTRLFVVGRLRKPSAAQQSKTSFMIPLLDFEGLPKTTVDRSVYDKFLAGRPVLQNALETKAEHVIVIGCIEPAGNDWWRCLDLAGFAAGRSLIPVESSYEAQMASYLMDAGRTFIKPVHVGEAGTGEHRPDFILLDTSPRTMVEVWGMRTPEYLASKAQRLARYRERNIPVISWSPIDQEDLPVLPHVYHAA